MIVSHLFKGCLNHADWQVAAQTAEKCICVQNLIVLGASLAVLFNGTVGQVVWLQMDV